LIQKPTTAQQKRSVSGRSARLRQMRLPAVHPLYLYFLHHFIAIYGELNEGKRDFAQNKHV